LVEPTHQNLLQEVQVLSRPERAGRWEDKIWAIGFAGGLQKWQPQALVLHPQEDTILWGQTTIQGAADDTGDQETDLGGDLQADWGEQADWN